MARRSFFSPVSSGERSFIWAIVGTSILGAVLACVAVMRLSETDPTSHYEVAYASWAGFAGFIGGAVGFWSAHARWFGYHGTSGWLSALVGAIAVSGMGSVIAGTLILPIYGTMFGPLQLITTMIESPALAIVWFGMLMCAHGLLVSWRVERESIFSDR